MKTRGDGERKTWKEENGGMGPAALSPSLVPCLDRLAHRGFSVQLH